MTSSATYSDTTTTFVLVHGAWHDSRAWSRVAPRLVERGYRTFTPSLTGRLDSAHLLGPEIGLSTHTQDVVDLLAAHDLHDVILVGHSYAGMVITSVVHQIPERIAGLVYLDAMVPVHGESALDVRPSTQGLIDAAATTPEPWRIPPLPGLPAPWGRVGVTDPIDLAWLATTLVDESVRCFTEPVAADNPDAARVPRVHIHCVGYEPPGFVRRPVPETQPNGEPEQIYEIRSGHDCMIIAPAEVTDLLVDTAARWTQRSSD